MPENVPDPRDERDHQSTASSPYPYDDGDGDGDGDGAPARDVGGAPTWPIARADAGGGAGERTQRAAATGVLPLLLSASLGINVALLIVLAGTLGLARAGAFAPQGSSPAGAVSHMAGAGMPTGTALGSPTPLLAAGGWLQLAPTSVQLGCDGDQQTQSVMLTNAGPHRVQWQAVFDSASDQAGVEVSPNQGDLRAGASVVFQVSSTNPSITQQGVVRFEPDSSAAGTPPASPTAHRAAADRS